MGREIRYKICVITPSEFSSKGGLEIFVHQLSYALADKGQDVSVICSKAETCLSFSGLKVYPILESGRWGFLRNLFKLYSFIKYNNFDIIHAHSFPAEVEAVVGKIFSIPVIVTSHGMDIQLNRDLRYGARLNKINAFLIKIALNLIDLHVVINETMVNDAIESGSSAEKIVVINNGIDLGLLMNALRTPNTEIFYKLKLKKNDFIILFLGRLHPKKCPIDLLIAFSEVVKVVPNAKLIMAGKGVEENKLKTFVKQESLERSVLITGFVSEEDKWKLLRICDLFVLPSAIEGHPITVIEAMACAKTVIVSDQSPFPELIKNGETGILVPIHSPHELAEAIIEISKDDNRLREIGLAAKEEVINRFNMDVVADRYLNAYKKIIKRDLKEEI